MGVRIPPGALRARGLVDGHRPPKSAHVGSNPAGRARYDRLVEPTICRMVIFQDERGVDCPAVAGRSGSRERRTWRADVEEQIRSM